MEKHRHVPADLSHPPTSPHPHPHAPCRSRATLPRWRCGWRTPTAASPRWRSSSSTSWPRRSTRYDCIELGIINFGAANTEALLLLPLQSVGNQHLPAPSLLPPAGHVSHMQPAAQHTLAYPACPHPIPPVAACRARPPSTTCCPTSCPTCPRSGACPRGSSSRSCSRQGSLGQGRLRVGTACLAGWAGQQL